MTPEMEEAMALQNPGDGFLQDDPGAPIQVPTQDGGMTAMDPEALAAEGLSFAYRDMANNHPVRPLHSVEDQMRGLDQNKMTRAQLEEQKMNENQGYPSNLDEAQKVKDLEAKSAEQDRKLDLILSHLQGQPFQENVPPAATTGGSPASPAVSPTPTQVQSGTSTPPSPPSSDSSGSNEPMSEPPRQRIVQLQDGRKIAVPFAQTRPVSVGSAPVTAVGPEHPETQFPPCPYEELPPSDVAETLVGDDEWADESVVTKLQDPEPPPPVDPKLEKTQQLVQDVFTFLQANDPHSFWRKHIGRTVHRHVGYHGWSKTLQAQFNERFQILLNDAAVVTNLCRKVLDMEMGHILDVKKVASFVVIACGYTSLMLAGLEN